MTVRLPSSNHSTIACLHFAALVLVCSTRALAASPALVPDPAVAVSLDAPRGCPTAGEIESHIEERLGRALEPEELRMHGTIEPAGDGFVLRLETHAGGRRDERELSAATCRPLGEAAALIGALSVDAVRTASVLEGTQTVPETDAPREPAPEPIRSRPARTFVTPMSTGGTGGTGDTAGPTAPEVALALEGGLGVSVLPGLTGAVGGRMLLLWRAWALQVGGQYLTPRTTVRDEGGVRVQMGTTDVRACGLVRGLRWALPLCAGLELGAMRGEGRAVANARTQQGLWLAGLLSVGYWGWVHPRIGLGLRADATVAAIRPQFELRGPGPQRELFTPPLVGVRLLAGIQFLLFDPTSRRAR